jgi:hypothetical protein
VHALPCEDSTSAIVGRKANQIDAADNDTTADAHAAGLLGLNFLSNFRMDIDTEKGVLNLEKK